MKIIMITSYWEALTETLIFFLPQISVSQLEQQIGESPRNVHHCRAHSAGGGRVSGPVVGFPLPLLFIIQKLNWDVYQWFNLFFAFPLLENTNWVYIHMKYKNVGKLLGSRSLDDQFWHFGILTKIQFTKKEIFWYFLKYVQTFTNFHGPHPIHVCSCHQHNLLSQHDTLLYCTQTFCFYLLRNCHISQQNWILLTLQLDGVCGRRILPCGVH